MEKFITFSQWLHENKCDEGLTDFITNVVEPNWFSTGAVGSPERKRGGIIPTGKAIYLAGFKKPKIERNNVN